MLKSINIKNLAIIKSIHIDWSKGLNILTGETGAGKSILFDALNIALGGKANTSYIRANTNKAVIEAIFQVTPAVNGWLIDKELIDPDQPDLIVSREISKSGSRARINGTLVNHSLLKELRLIITFHAQHEIRTLMANSTQLSLLDGIAPKEHLKKLADYKSCFTILKSKVEKLTQLEISQGQRARRLDFAQFQFDELNNAMLKDVDEDTELEEQQKRLGNIQEIEQNLETIINELSGSSNYEDSSSSAAIDNLQTSVSLINSLWEYDSSLTSAKELLESSLASAEEASSLLRKYSNTVSSDPETLALVEDRLNTLASIKRKYGPSLLEAINQRDKLEKEIDELESSDSTTSKLKEEILELEKTAKAKAKNLSKERQTIASSLESSIMLELKDLGMERAQFKIEFTLLSELTQSGLDKVEFKISTNPGTPLMPLSKIASGGELSRIMLALKTIFARCDDVQTVVFDEIDAGMSGVTLHAIREKLARLAKSHQIISITHNPIVASVADNHIQVQKEQLKTETIISVSTLDENETLNSIAKMASGDSSKEESLNFARSLVKDAHQIKSTVK